jgi:hypothetical protein
MLLCRDGLTARRRGDDRAPLIEQADQPNGSNRPASPNPDQKESTIATATARSITSPTARVIEMPSRLADGAAFASAAGPGDRGGMTIELTKDGRHVGFAPLSRADAVQLALQTLELAILFGELTTEERAHVKRFGATVDWETEAAEKITAYEASAAGTGAR